jgi:hypothetical protein
LRDSAAVEKFANSMLRSSAAHRGAEHVTAEAASFRRERGIWRLQTMRGPKAGTGTASPNVSTFITASWWHSSHVTDSERAPFSRMLANVIGGPR